MNKPKFLHRLCHAVLLPAGLAVLMASAAWSARADHVTQQLELRFDTELSTPRANRNKDEFNSLRAFYAERGFAPLWLDHKAPNELAKSFVDILMNSHRHGLYPTDYATQILSGGLNSGSEAEMADFEYNLSRALIRYGSDLSAGRVDPARVDSELYIYPSEAAAKELLAAAARGNEFLAFLEGLAPQSKEYRRLKAGLADYRKIDAAGGWATVGPGDTIKPGMRGPRVAQLRKRLATTGDVTASAGDPQTYDKELEKSVKWFQYRHGLDQDGAVGAKTIAALNVPVKNRIEQMLINMERRRWMPDDLGATYVFVNMADFVVKVVDGPKTIHDSRVVVGKPYFRTPVFSDMMRYIVLNPYWTVPPSIARNEILPKLRKNPNHLVEKNMTLFSGWGASAKRVNSTAVDWNSVTKRKMSGYKVRQEPGKGNALGNVKFMFPNKFNIYLHDTPSKTLFQKSVRSFSHGCIRVQYPETFAAVLLRDQEGWSEENIKAAIATKKRQVVRLKKPIPVHLTYLTARVNKDGSVHFRDDIYSRDERLKKALDRLQRPL